MRAFTFERPDSVAAAAKAVAKTPGAKFIAGGTNLLDLMKLEVETADPPRRRQPAAARPRSRRRSTAACGSARWCATAISPQTRAFARITAC